MDDIIVHKDYIQLQDFTDSTKADGIMKYFKLYLGCISYFLL